MRNIGKELQFHLVRLVQPLRHLLDLRILVLQLFVLITQVIPLPGNLFIL